MISFNKVLLALTLPLLVAACAQRGGTGGDEGERQGRMVGMLHHSPPGECRLAAGCGPEFNLLNERLDRFTPLYGSFEPEHHHLVIEVDGRPTDIRREDREFLGTLAADRAIRSRRYRVLSEIPFHDFLVEQASAFTTRKYGCDLLWDKTFSWRFVDERVHLVVRMTNTMLALDPKPYLELTFDGTTGHFLEEELEPWGINPCDRQS